MVGTRVFAYDFKQENSDGQTLYYRYINEGKELEVVGAGYVGWCGGNVNIPEEVTYMGKTRKVTSIGYQAFEKCSLYSVTLPNSISDIKERAFYGCSLTSINIPDGVVYISQKAFYACMHLTSLTLPNSVTNVDAEAFYNCNSLTYIKLSDNLINIGSLAFYNCSQVESIILPSSLKSIDSYAFSGCNFSVVTSQITEPFKISTNTFSDNTFYNATLKVPNGTVEKYKSTEGWEKFFYIESVSGGDNEFDKCKSPTISYQNGKLVFNSETSGVSFQYTISDTDIKSSVSSKEVQLNVTYKITVFATKEGYKDSDIATATLCWIDVEPKTEGITDGISQMAARAVMVKAEGGQLTIEGAEDNTNISVYSIDGVQVGTSTSRKGVASIMTTIPKGSVAIVKIGNKSIKVIMR